VKVFRLVSAAVLACREWTEEGVLTRLAVRSHAQVIAARVCAKFFEVCH
jgi:hypothetical protein